MTLRQLHCFAAVAEHLHFGRAARQLHISQPSLSQQIRKLEEEIGVQFLSRTKRRVELTDAGKVFLKEAQFILAQVNHAVQTANCSRLGETGRLLVGFVPSDICTILPEILRLFHDRHPNITLVVDDTTTGGGIAAVKEKKLHLCFVRLPIRDAALTTEVILKDSIALALPEGHQLSRSAKASLSQLSDEPFVIFPRSLDSGLYDQIVASCHQAGFSPRVVQEASHIQTILGLVAAGIGVALIPESVQNLQRTGLVYRPLRDRIPASRIAIASLSGNVSPVINHFVAVAKEVGGRIPFGNH